MAMLGINLEETKNFNEQIKIVRDKIKSDEKYKHDLINQGNLYQKLKEFLMEFAGYLKYRETLPSGVMYRVRKCKNETPYTKREELIYPPPSTSHKDRMNNHSFRVLYTAFHEYTAMAEARLSVENINEFFQLTRFKSNKPLTVYKLGLFSDLWFNNLRGSEETKKRQFNLFGSDQHDGALKGFSSLEYAIAEILYDTAEDYHILSSAMADAIFETNKCIEAIIYPSMQNRYGTNLAIRKESADELEINYTNFNKLTNVYKDGFYDYQTISECLDVSNPENYKFTDEKLQPPSKYCIR